MPVNPYAKGALDAARALPDLFVGRASELDVLRDQLSSIARGSPDAWILHVHGVAGSGKSTLLRKLREDTPGVRLATLDVDSDAFSPRSGAADLLWQLRFALRRAGVRTPLYDLFYVAYFSRHVLPGVGLTLPGLLESLGRGTEPVEKASAAGSSSALSARLADAFDADFLRDVGEGAGELAKGLKGVQLAAKLASAFRKRSQRRTLRARGIDLSAADAGQMHSLAPEVLAADLVDGAARQAPLAIAVDGFERLQTEPQALRVPAAAESALEALVRFVMFAPGETSQRRIGFLFFGRERLRWPELYDRDDGSASWSSLIRHLALRALDRAQAEAFLQRADRALDAAGAARAAQALRASRAAILDASREHAAGDSERSEAFGYLPFRLRLCIEEIALVERPFTVDDARRHADDVCASFLRAVPATLRDALHAFAVAGEVDASLFEAMIREDVVHAFSIADFSLLVARDALFAPVARPGTFRLHFQLERSALELLRQTAASREIAATVAEAIARLHIRHATPPTFAELTADHLERYQEGMRLLFRVDAAGLLPIDRFAVLFVELEDALRHDVAIGGAMHEAWLRCLFERSSSWSVDDGRMLVDSPRRTRSGKRARQIIQPMVVQFNSAWIGDAARAAAKAMFTRMYSSGVFPPADGEHADDDTLAALAIQRAATGAGKLADQGRHAEAEALLRAALEALPPTLAPRSRAKLQGDLELELAHTALHADATARAHALLDEALAHWRSAGLDGMAFASRALGYCNAMIGRIGDVGTAEALLRQITPLLERELPASHPSRAELATTFAILCVRKGFAALAIPYLETAQRVLVDNYGDAHPRVLAHRALLQKVCSMPDD